MHCKPRYYLQLTYAQGHVCSLQTTLILQVHVKSFREWSRHRNFLEWKLLILTHKTKSNSITCKPEKSRIPNIHQRGTKFKYYMYAYILWIRECGGLSSILSRKVQRGPICTCSDCHTFPCVCINFGDIYFRRRQRWSFTYFRGYLAY